MEAALEQLRAEGVEVRPEDVARLSPLQTHHINMLGQYAFLLAEALAPQVASLQTLMWQFLSCSLVKDFRI